MKDLLISLSVMIFYITLASGWIMNIVQLVQNHYTDTMVTFKVIGIIVAPIGVFLGWIG